MTVRYTENGGTSVQEAKVYGDGLVVFDKIPPGTYFLKETQAPKLKPDDAASTLRYEAAEEIYKLVVDGKGYFTLYTAGSKDADGKPIWTTVTEVETAKTKLVKVGDAYTLPGTAGANAEGTVGIYSVMNVSPLTRKVILKKVKAAGDPYEPLDGKEFRIYRADLSEYTDGQVSGGGYVSGASGVYFIGELPYGVYYLEEKADPAIWFWLIVDESGTYMPGLTEAGGAVQYGSKEDAMTAAAAKLDDLRKDAPAAGD